MNEGQPQAIHDQVIHIDDSRWPIVVITRPARELGDEEFSKHLNDLTRYSDRGGPFGFVIDARLAPTPKAHRRRLMAEYIDATFQRDDRCLGFAIVLTSPIARGVFKAIQWLRQGTHPFTAVSSVKEGIDWLRSLERQRKLAP